MHKDILIELQENQCNHNLNENYRHTTPALSCLCAVLSGCMFTFALVSQLTIN